MSDSVVLFAEVRDASGKTVMVASRPVGGLGKSFDAGRVAPEQLDAALEAASEGAWSELGAPWVDPANIP